MLPVIRRGTLAALVISIALLQNAPVAVPVRRVNPGSECDTCRRIEARGTGDGNVLQVGIVEAQCGGPDLAWSNPTRTVN